MKKIICLTAVICAVFTTAVCPAGEMTQMDEVVVTAGRIKEPVKAIVSNVTIIDEEEISLSPATDLGDLLAQKGIGYIKKYPGNLTSIGIRGFRTESHGNDLKGHVLILLNGRRAGTGNAAKIMTENVERIEIIRGPASVQYGSAAMGGVVNVITRQGKEDPSLFIQGGIGSFGYSDVSLGASGETNGFDFSGSVTRETEDDYTTAEGDIFKNTGMDYRQNFSLSLGYKFSPGNRIGVMVHSFDVDEAGSPDYLSQNDLDDTMDKSNYSYDITYDGRTSQDKFLWTLRYFAGEDEDLWKDPTASNPSGWDDGVDYWRKTETKGLQGQIAGKFGTTQITTGFDWLDYEIEKSAYDPTQLTYENLAGFLLGKIKLFDDRLVLSAGGRYDKYEVAVVAPPGNTEEDNNFTPNAGLSFLLTDQIKLRAGYAGAFVMPSADHLAANYTSGANQYIGNPNLTPEKSETYEGGVDFSWPSITASLTYFHTDFKDWIGTDRSTSGIVTWVNEGEALLQGFEGNFSCDIGAFLDIDFEIRPFIGFTYLTEYENRDTGEKLLETHDLTASYGLILSSWNGFSARLNIAYFGEKTITDYESGWPYQVIEVEDFTVADLSISKILYSSDSRGKLTLNAAARNLFDEEYQFVKGYPMPERNFYLGLRYDY